MKKLCAFFLSILLHITTVQAAGMPETIWTISGVHPVAGRLSDSVLLVIDAQREYLDGKLPLAGMTAAIQEAARLLGRARQTGTPVIHIVHRGKGNLFNPKTTAYQIIPALMPITGEAVIEKTLPNAFVGTALAEALVQTGRRNLIVIGYMTHNCVSATVRAALDYGYRTTIVASATATRDLPDGKGGVLAAAEVQVANLAGLADRTAVVLDSSSDLVD